MNLRVPLDDPLNRRCWSFCKGLFFKETLSAGGLCLCILFVDDLSSLFIFSLLTVLWGRRYLTYRPLIPFFLLWKIYIPPCLSSSSLFFRNSHLLLIGARAIEAFVVLPLQAISLSERDRAGSLSLFGPLNRSLPFIRNPASFC